MDELAELKATQAEILALVGKVGADVDALHTKLDNIPTAGMTPEQAAAVSEALATAKSIKDGLASIDAKTPEAVDVPAVTPDA